jgi:chaperonin GroEL
VSALHRSALASAVEDQKGANEDPNHGLGIARCAMEAPLRQFVTNAGEVA